MALSTPTTAQINANIIAQLEATLGQTIPLLPKAFLRVLSKVLAGVFILLYKYSGFMFLQIFVATASNDETEVNGELIRPLTLWGELIGIGSPAAAVSAVLTIEITVTNQTGSIPSNTQLLGDTNGVTYLTQGAVTLDAATKQVNVIAAADPAGGGGAGIVGNLADASTMSFANPIANVVRQAAVVTTVTTGADAETTENYRQRVLDRFQKRPQGGAMADYEIWGEEPAGIRAIYPYTGFSPGTVDVYVEAVETGGNDRVPSAAQLTEVEDAITYGPEGNKTRLPASTVAIVNAVTIVSFDVTVHNLVVDNAATVQASIDDAVTDFLLEAAPFIDGLTIPPRKDTLTQSGLISLVNTVVAANNGTITNVTFEVTGSGTPRDKYILQQGELAKLGNPVVFA